MKKVISVSPTFITACLAMLILVVCCNKNTLNLTVENVVDSAKIGKIKSVLILGNSIVWHPPENDIGWKGDWGMAASTRDSDFVHILIRNLHQKDTSITIEFKNISDFEKDFDTYDFSKLDTLKNPDMVIMKIAENVNDDKAMKDGFIDYYDSLLDYIDPDKKAVRILVDGFWPNKNVNKDILNYALAQSDPFIAIDDLSNDITNEAINEFSNPQVGKHPSDKGMRLIAGRIWNYMKNYFK